MLQAQNLRGKHNFRCYSLRATLHETIAPSPILTSKKAGEIMSPYNPTHASKNAFKDFPDVVSVEELSVMLGHISTKTCYKLLRSGAIQHLRIGRLYRIPKICVINYLASAKTDSDK
jgi:excisionase family DNA binding protein